MTARKSKSKTPLFLLLELVLRSFTRRRTAPLRSSLRSELRGALTNSKFATLTKILWWSWDRESNPEPHPYQGCALPTELSQHAFSLPQKTPPFKMGFDHARGGWDETRLWHPESADSSRVTLIEPQDGRLPPPQLRRCWRGERPPKNYFEGSLSSRILNEHFRVRVHLSIDLQVCQAPLEAGRQRTTVDHVREISLTWSASNGVKGLCLICRRSYVKLLSVMAKCELCGKGTVSGKISTHKHGGMWAHRAPSTKRQWKPNLRRVKVQIGGTTKTVRICAKCLKSARVKKVTV